jgi:Fe-S cluster assembly protein SufD
MNSEQQYIDLFRQCRMMIDSHSAPVLNALREQAFQDFLQQGFPTQKVERYKYTDVAAAFAPDYGVNLNRLDIPVNPYEVFKCDVPNLSTSLYFMVNDAFYSKIQPAVALPEGMIVCSLREAAQQYPDLVARYYGKQARTGKDALNALNTMLAQDGLFVYVPRGVAAERTLQIVNILRSDVDLMVNRRVLIVLEDNAEARILFCDHAADDRSFLTTQIAEVYVGNNARLQLYELEETHVKNKRFGNLYVDQQADSNVSLNTITLHNGLTRNRSEVTLSGERAETNLYGCVIADKQQHVDHNTLIDHRVSHCTSNQLYKYVLDDQAVGAFAGRILVRENAQHTVSNERNANLCATKEARMYAQPMLEIYADDVKCSHGSTVGQLNEQALFYMQQRGISREEAQMLLRFAFAGEVIDCIAIDALRDRLHHLVEKRFRGELSRCSGCKICK